MHVLASRVELLEATGWLAEYGLPAHASSDLRDGLA